MGQAATCALHHKLYALQQRSHALLSPNKPTFGAIIMLVVNSLAKRLRRWASYRNTVRELSQLSDRGLQDLGIARGEIRFVAKKHAKAA